MQRQVHGIVEDAYDSQFVSHHYENQNVARLSDPIGWRRPLTRVP